MFIRNQKLTTISFLVNVSLITGCKATSSNEKPKDAMSLAASNSLTTPGTPIVAETILHKVPPVYPAIAKAAGVQGSVKLHAIIATDGTVESLEAISGPLMLQGAAVDAVKQWVYKPYLLNGIPRRVDTTVTVNFQLVHKN